MKSASRIIELHNLAARLGSGDGVKRNIGLSRKHYAQAARLGSGHAYYELGMSYLCDKPKSIDKGLRYLKRAASSSIVDAQQLLGDMYARGMFGQTKNLRAALLWYRKAAARGDKRAKAAIKELRNT
jgi:TPR repeat protein